MGHSTRSREPRFAFSAIATSQQRRAAAWPPRDVASAGSIRGTSRPLSGLCRHGADHSEDRIWPGCRACGSCCRWPAGGPGSRCAWFLALRRSPGCPGELGPAWDRVLFPAVRQAEPGSVSPRPIEPVRLDCVRRENANTRQTQHGRHNVDHRTHPSTATQPHPINAVCFRTVPRHRKNGFVAVRIVCPGAVPAVHPCLEPG